ncbi:MAG: hypothetical protein ACRDNW_12285 [Trebonia sp.]
MIATVITLIYYRLTAAHGEQPEPAQDQGGYGPYGGGYGGGGGGNA